MNGAGPAGMRSLDNLWQQHTAEYAVGDETGNASSQLCSTVQRHGLEEIGCLPSKMHPPDRPKVVWPCLQLRVISRTWLSSIGDMIFWSHLGLFRCVNRLDSTVPARNALECAYARRTKICPPSGWRRPPGRPRQTWLRRIGDGSAAAQPPSAKNGTFQSDVDILGKRDRRYGPPRPKRFWGWWWCNNYVRLPLGLEAYQCWPPIVYRVGQNAHGFHCNNFVYFQPIFIIFGTCTL